MIRWIVVLFIIIFNVIFQSTVIQELNIGGTSLNLLLITTVSFGLIRGKVEGAVIGFIIGFFQDTFYGNVLGFYALLYMYTGFICGYFNRSFYRDSLLIPLSIIGTSDLVLNIFIYIFTYLFRGKMEFAKYFQQIIFPEFIYTTFLSLFIYKLYLVINHKIEKYETRKEDINSL